MKPSIQDAWDIHYYFRQNEESSNTMERTAIAHVPVFFTIILSILLWVMFFLCGKFQMKFLGYPHS